MADPAADPEARVLLLAPTGRDAAAACDLLAADGIGCRVCADLAEVCREAAAGAGAVVVTEEAALADADGRLARLLGDQPAWSDLPVIVLTARGRTPDRRLEALLGVGAVSLLKRPLDLIAFRAAVRSALRDRNRQYQVRDHLVELGRQAEALREADRRKDEFLAMLAHELRNPLAPVRNGVALLRAGGADPAAVARVGESMERQVGHLARLVDDLLDVSRIHLGKVELRPEEVDLAEVAATAVEAAAPLIDARRHTLTVSRPDPPVRLRADPARLAQVIGNLLNNAAKYTDPGGHITLTLGRDGGEAVIRVRDTGAGIAADMLPRVFDLFTQVDRTLDRSQGGLGVGLTLVRRLAELHGGWVRASSGGPGAGSEFEVRLPALAAGAAKPGANGRPRRAARPNYRVLVVDDNADAADSLALLLELAGDTVRTAGSGPRALEVAGSFRPEVVLLDIGLPGMDGYEVARRLRGQPDGGRVLLVALTGYGRDDDRRRAAEAGFDHHLTKPADPAAVNHLLAAARRPQCG
ncbi:MAG: response regulator [Gemmataceae bacterium]|nr:response regulator [Gemmataceae bacterium]